jgi:molybdopterin molybdotransferase
MASRLPGYDPGNLRVDIAREVIRLAIAPIVETERVSLRDALGRVLAHDILSPIDVPASDNAAMDGYAVRASDLRADAETPLVEIGTAFAGRPYAGTVAPGECVRIMTGAVMPAGSDTVVVKEVVRTSHGKVIIPAGQQAGQNRRHAGEDLMKGKPALPAGTRLGPAELGLIASLGIPQVAARRRLRAAFFSTGDELRDAGQDAGPGTSYDSNRYTLYGLLTRLGCDTLDLGVVADDPQLIESRFRQAAGRADLVITSGGVSVGEADFTAPMMARLGEVLLWKMAMRPGRPLAFGRIAAEGNAAWLFGLPGNPVASMVAFCQFVRPAILALAGQRDCGPPSLPARLALPIRKKRGRTEYPRGTVKTTEGAMTVTPAANQGSGVLRSMSEANCLIVLEHERGDVAAGEMVTVQLLAGLL